MRTDASYSIADLARLTGNNVRTIRYYIAQGLIPSSGESGRGSHYGEGHLGRLRLVKRLQGQHLPLAEIRHRLAALTDAEVTELVGAATEVPGAPQTSALDYVRNLLGATPPTDPPPASLISAAEAPVSLARARKAMPLAALRQAGNVLGTGPSLGSPAMPRMRDVPARPPAATDRTAMEPRATEVRATEVPATEAQPPERSQWERHSLGPNIELHVRRPLSRLEQRRVERLITIARQVLKEDGV